MTVNMHTGEIVEPLTAMERSGLVHAEAVIERGLNTFTEVGEALSKVRDERLYRDQFPTFEAYCRDRWGITDRRARQMIDAASIVEALPTGSMLPVNERQAAELRGLEPERAANVMRQAHATTNGNVTARAIRVARDDDRPVQPPPVRATPRRALTDAARDAGQELRKATERLERLGADDRFTANKNEVAAHLRHHLDRAIEVCQDLNNRINN